MAYNYFETSVDQGRPLFLYRFSLGESVWRYTSADSDVVLGSDTWTAVPISDDGMKQTGEAVTEAMTITASSKITPAQMYLSYPPSRQIQVSILALHDGDTETRAVYAGEVTQCNVTQPGTVKLTCETLSATMAREGLRLTWQRSCPYALYDPVTCKVNKTAFSAAALVTAQESNVLTVPSLSSFAAGYFSGGFVEWSDPVRGRERRGIEEHTNDGEVLLTLFGGAAGIDTGAMLDVFPGCSRNVAGCTKFNNLLNYGGVLKLAGKSPFDGSAVFY